MKTIVFRYNRYKPGLSLLLPFFVLLLLGLGCFVILNHRLGLDSGGLPPLFQQHAGYLLLLILSGCVILPIVSIILSLRIWLILTECRGKMELYEDHAILFFKGNELRIDQESVIEAQTISFGGSGYSPVLPNLEEYCILTEDKTYRIAESFAEGFRKTTAGDRLHGRQPITSLALAMQALALASGACVSIGTEKKNVKITLGSTTPAIFDGTPYYVEYAPKCTAGIPFAVCWVRERADPNHVVGRIGMDADPAYPEQFTEECLRTRRIVYARRLDEMLGISGNERKKLLENDRDLFVLPVFGYVGSKKNWPLNSVFFGGIFALTVLIYIGIRLYVLFLDVSAGTIFYFKRLFGDLVPAALLLCIWFGRRDWKTAGMMLNLLVILCSLPILYLARGLPAGLSDIPYLAHPEQTVLTDTVLWDERVFGRHSNDDIWCWDGIDENGKQQRFFFPYSNAFGKKVFSPGTGFTWTDSSTRVREEKNNPNMTTHNTYANPIQILYLPHTRVMVDFNEVKAE